MAQAGVRRDAFTYTALLHACQPAGRWQQALDWFGELQAQAEEEGARAAQAAAAAGAGAAALEDPEAGAAAAGAAALEEPEAAPGTAQAGSRAAAAAAEPGKGPAPLAANAVHYTALMTVLQRAGRWEQAMQVRAGG